VLDEIGRYETVLIQHPRLADTGLADRIVRRLEGIVIARSWSLLEYNVPRSRLAEAERITPGFNSPTIMQLEDSSRCAVRAMVKRGEVHAVMERLEVLGASAIIETRIGNCRL
jgi:ATP phosphoribosyltransferase